MAPGDIQNPVIMSDGIHTWNSENLLELTISDGKGKRLHLRFQIILEAKMRRLFVQFNHQRQFER